MIGKQVKDPIADITADLDASILSNFSSALNPRKSGRLLDRAQKEKVKSTKIYKFLVLPVVVLSAIVLVTLMILGIVELVQDNSNHDTHHWMILLATNWVLSLSVSLCSRYIEKRLVKVH